ncbi:MAG: DUF7452 domain-containing protein [Acidimicrobiales bacterium]
MRATFVHRADLSAGNIQGHLTVIDHPGLNDVPGAVPVVTPNWNPHGAGGVYNNHAVGAGYEWSTGRWTVVNLDGGSILDGASFNVDVMWEGPDAYVHGARPSNSAGNSTYLDHPALNGNPKAVVLATPVRHPTDSGFMNHCIGIWYSPSVGRWAVFNQDGAAMEENALFSVRALRETSPSLFVHRSSPASAAGNASVIDHPAVNGDPDVLLLVTPNWNPYGLGGVFNDRPTGVWYDGTRGRWTVFNQDLIAMPADAAFNIEVLEPSGAFIR